MCSSNEENVDKLRKSGETEKYKTKIQIKKEAREVLLHLAGEGSPLQGDPKCLSAFAT